MELEEKVKRWASVYFIIFGIVLMAMALIKLFGWSAVVLLIGYVLFDFGRFIRGS